MKRIWRTSVVWCGVLLLAACSTTKKLTDGQLLYTGVKKIDIEMGKGVRLEDPSRAVLMGTLAYPPNNPLYSPYVRTPFPVGLWVYNWNLRREKGLKYLIYKQLAKKPILISEVNPDLRLNVVTLAAKDYGYFGVRARYTLVPNRHNPKKAKISYSVYIPKPYVLGEVTWWGWNKRMDSILQKNSTQSLLIPGEQYDVSLVEKERERVTTLLRDEGYYFFQSDYIEMLADSTGGEGGDKPPSRVEAGDIGSRVASLSIASNCTRIERFL